MVIAVICPSWNNPGALIEAALSCLDTKMLEDTRFIAALNENDPQLFKYVERLHDLPGFPIIVPKEKGGTMNRVLNHAAMRVTEWADIVSFVGDDHRFRTRGWDRVISEVLSGGGFAYGNDLMRNDLPAQVFISSPIIRALGWMGLPGAIHLYLDNTWRTLGEEADCLYYLPDIVIEHLHPAIGKGEWDENHRRVNMPEVYDHDLRVYEEWFNSNRQSDVEKVKAVT